MQKLDPQQKERERWGGSYTILGGLELPARYTPDEKTTIRFFSYVVFFIFHIGILVQWDSKFLGLNTAKWLDWATRGDPIPLGSSR